MNLNEKNYVLAFALDDINYIVTENAGNNPGDIKKQYDCNKAAFDQIAKVIANAMRLDLIGGDLGTYFTPEAVRKFAEEQSKKDEGLSFEDAPNLNEVLRNPPFKGGQGRRRANASASFSQSPRSASSFAGTGAPTPQSSSPRGATIATATSTCCAWSATETPPTAAGARRLRTTDTSSSSSARRTARTASNSHSRP